MPALNPVAILAAKRDGRPLADDQIGSLIEGIVVGRVPDYQAAAFLMAVYLRGMNATETAALTHAMLRSGTTLAWPDDGRPVVDKHSSGGIGDKTSLVLAPLLACCGLRVPMISGRGLGPTGGTLDKLESIPGFRTDLSLDEIRQLVSRVGCVITGTTTEIAPADRILYALRDVTATVPSIPLITASIMSKKLAEGLQSLVLDVKVGSGAFMKRIADARVLAESLTATGRRMNVATTALITDMNQPLGRLAGNAVEVDESIEVLQGGGPADLIAVTVRLGAELLVACGSEPSLPAAVARLRGLLVDGQAFTKFVEMVTAQGGNLQARRAISPAHEVRAERAGYLAAIDTEALGWLLIDLRAGRRTAGDRIDHGQGLEMGAQIGDKVDRGQPLGRLFCRPDEAAAARARFIAAVTIADAAPNPPPLFVESI